MILLNGIVSALIFAGIAVLFGNPPIILGIIGFFVGIWVVIVIESL